MTVLVETNFILEIAFLQEQHTSCLAILDLAEKGEIDLVLPAFSVAEPYYTLEGRRKKRAEFKRTLDDEIKEMSRSVPYKDSSGEFQKLTGLLVKSAEEDKQRFEEGWDRILNIAQLIPINLEIIRAAIEYQKTLGFENKPQDSMVYASVIYHLSNTSSEANCFITSNKNDFVNPDIKSELATYNCKILYSFKDALGYIKSLL
jgi:predicted nucleic acid-binding protein